jgi:hypothetical protein
MAVRESNIDYGQRDLRPVPDPTVLTTQQLTTAITSPDVSLRSLRMVCFATPVIRHVALMEVPSTKAAITWERSEMLKRFILIKCLRFH